MAPFNSSVLYLNQALWSLALALSLQFLFIGIWIRPFRHYLYFGSSLFLAAAILTPFAWLDEFIYLTPTFAALIAIRISWAVAALIGYSFVVFHRKVSNLAKHPLEKSALALTCILVLAMLAELPFRSGLMIRLGEEQIAFTPLYLVFFLSYVFLIFPLFARYAYLGLKVAPAERKGGFRLVVASAVIYGLTASLDVAGGPFPTLFFGFVYSLVGVSVYAVAVANILYMDFQKLFAERQASLEGLERAYSRLKETLRFRRLGINTAGISHDIRNYSSILTGNVPRAFCLPKPASRRSIAFSEIVEALETLSTRISGRSDGQKVKSGSQESLEDVARHCAARFESSGLSFEIAEWPARIHLKVDRLDMERVFNNLFRNALEAGARRIVICFETGNGRLVARVSDDGSGFSQKGQLDFPSFTSSKKKSGGIGLGLSIVLGVLSRYGGKISTFRHTSKEGKWTVIVLVFPVFHSPASPDR